MNFVVIVAGVMALLVVIVAGVRLLRMSEADIQRDINKIAPVDKVEKHRKEIERQRGRWQGRRRRR